MQLQEARKPSVVVLTQEFVHIAERVAALKGHANLRQIVLPYPLEGRPDEEVTRIAEDAYPRLLAALGGVADQ